ncbi:MAG TPA: enolase C-terminal domain-like protein [Oligoflexus sp.]|uniref:enolase C-terminal domain-like protein n=1 Tax=Oligoflexus sp. TaxID=1971216 RepID=UPI002D80CAB2|nr:enolase C-terminal domain-like protein [Oligoflexus sp.]HET9240127.1 enolase C-terminal domain-like protein [Oligoflexus sp.]
MKLDEKGPPITAVDVLPLTVPTDEPEADGTLEWTETTMIVVRIHAGGQTGLGYTYSQKGAASIIQDVLAPALQQQDPFAIAALWSMMRRKVRNFGPGGVATMAIAAVDVALWDLKARLFQAPLVTLLGAARTHVPIYGSGGFLTYTHERLHAQLGGWAAEGLRFVKMKIGADLTRERDRIAVARQAIGPDVQLFIDANGALTPREALFFCETLCREHNVSWFEEPVSSENLQGLHHIRKHAPPQLDIAAGEYGFDPVYFRLMLEAESVDVLQADATRCGGYTGFLQVDALCDAFEIPLSAHTAPALHLPVCCAAQKLRHLEYFHDHVRLEKMLFEGFPKLEHGDLVPDLTRPGHGLSLRMEVAERYRV